MHCPKLLESTVQREDHGVALEAVADAIACAEPFAIPSASPPHCTPVDAPTARKAIASIGLPWDKPPSARFIPSGSACHECSQGQIRRR